MKNKYINSGGFKIKHILSNPEKIESKLVFDRNDISQKLIFILMEITYKYGFSCSKPYFDNNWMYFFVGTILPTNKSLNKYIIKLTKCLEEIEKFARKFAKQLDFSRIDISMFNDINLEEFYPERLVAIKDQQFNGSWGKFYSDLIKNDRKEDAKLINKCSKFEKINKKDLGLVGHKLNYIIFLLDIDKDEKDVN